MVFIITIANEIRRQVAIPAAVRLLCVDQIIIDNLRCRFPYCVHPLYPFHLVGCFERLRDTFLFGKFLYQPKEHILRLIIQIGKVAVELPVEEQPGIECLTVFTDISQMPLVSPVGSVGASEPAVQRCPPDTRTPISRWAFPLEPLIPDPAGSNRRAECS